MYRLVTSKGELDRIYSLTQANIRAREAALANKTRVRVLAPSGEVATEYGPYGQLLNYRNGI